MKYSLRMLFTLSMRTITSTYACALKLASTIIKMNDNTCGLFLCGEWFLPCHCCRLVKTVENAATVELRCLLTSAQSVNISQVWIRILTTVKNVEYVGKKH